MWNKIDKIDKNVQKLKNWKRIFFSLIFYNFKTFD